MITYGIIGAGWRSEFYLKIAALLPEDFKVSGIYIRNPKKQAEFLAKFSVKTVASLDELIKIDYDFIVSCVNKDCIWSMLKELCHKGIPVLTETPIHLTKPQLSEIRDNWKVQVAEQFHFMPRNIAIKKIIDSGILGEVNQVQLSCCHDYHAASLIRYFLNTGNEIPKIQTFIISDKVTRYNSRQGFIEPIIIDAEQTLKIFNFNTKTAVYDFNKEQYFSDIRSSRIIIRGTSGEIINNKCTYLNNDIPCSFNIIRNTSGINENLDGFSLLNLTGNSQILYENPFKKARLSDEEIAIASCLTKMKEYLQTGNDFYSLNEAALDYSFFL